MTTDVRGSLNPDRKDAIAGVDRFLTGAAKLQRLNMFIGLDADSLRQRVIDRSPEDRVAALNGQLFAVKDIVNVGGMATTGGTAALAGTVMAADAPIITRLRRAGAIVAAKTNMHELSLGVTSNNGVYGAVGNPYDPSRSAGGSSGGSAAAVATGLVPFAIAGDTGGSARLPASLCGVVGFRPTRGRYSMNGVLPLSPTRDTLGLFADSMARLRQVDAVISEQPVESTRFGPSVGRRLGFYSDLDDLTLDPGVAASYHSTLRSLELSGVDLVPIALSRFFDTCNRIGAILTLAEFPMAVRGFLAEMDIEVSFEAVGDGIGSPDVRRLWTSALHSPVPEEGYRAALFERGLTRRSFIEVLDDTGVEAIVFPTLPTTARPIGDDETTILRGEQVGTFDTFTRFANLAGVLGLPGVSLPSGTDERGLPIGIELDGRPGDDDRLLQIASIVTPLLDTVPPPHVARSRT